MRVFTYLVVGTTFIHLSVTTVAYSQARDDGIALRERVQQWNNWSRQFGDSTVTVDTSEMEDGKKRVNVRTIQRNRAGYLCVRVDFSFGHVSEHYINIQNPAYSARLQMGMNDEWVLTGLAVAGEPDYEEQLSKIIGGVDCFATKITEMPAHFLPLVLDQVGYSVSATDEMIDEIGAATVYTMQFKPGYLTVPPYYSMIRLHFAKSDLAPAVQIDYRLVNPIRGFSRVFRDWTKAGGGGQDVPATDLNYTPELPLPGLEPYGKALFDYANFDAPFDTATCYLSHYGIPEPAQVGKSGWGWWWILIGVGVALVIVGFVMRQRLAAAR